MCINAEKPSVINNAHNILNHLEKMKETATWGKNGDAPGSLAGAAVQMQPQVARQCTRQKETRITGICLETHRIEPRGPAGANNPAGF